MSNPKHERPMPPSDEELSSEDAALLADLGEALAASGELPPLDEAEVAELEATLGDAELELPASLRQYRPRLAEQSAAEQSAPEQSAAEGERDWATGLGGAGPESSPGGALIQLSERRPALAGAPRRAVLSHVVALTLGAAAATALLVAGGFQRTSGGAPSSEPLTPSPDAGVDAGKPIRVEAPSGCAKGCCAGSACTEPNLREAPPPNSGPAPGEALKQCSSGRTCVQCSGLDTTRYRVRSGGLIPTDYGRKLLAPARAGQLELCFRAASSRQYCVDAHASTDQDQTWRDLDLVVSAPDLIGGLSAEVRWRGAERPLATWSSPIRVNPTLLCNGLSVRPKNAQGELVGMVSVFLMDTHYVQLGTAQSTPALESLARRFSFSNLSPRIFELSAQPTLPDAGQPARFALTLGPFSETQAESLRWQVLNQGGEAQVVVGAEYHGDPRGIDQDSLPAAP